MIVTTRRFGRLANRLFLFSHLIAFSELTEVPIVDFAFDEYRKDFHQLRDQPYCIYSKDLELRKSLLQKCPLLKLKASMRLMPIVRFWDEHDVVFDGDSESDPRVIRMRDANVMMFEGWKFRSRAKILEIMPLLRDMFRPTNATREKIVSRVGKARDLGEIVIGLHVRWEDYRGTPTFFSLSQYRSQMEKCASLFEPRKVSFLVCSSDPIHQEDFPSNCLVSEQTTAIEDLYSLSECDYILGPPSTFSGWASFYGSKPLFTMRHETSITSLSQAVVIRG